MCGEHAEQNSAGGIEKFPPKQKRQQRSLDRLAISKAAPD